MADGVELATGYVSLVISGDNIGPGIKRQLGQAEGQADKAGRAAGKRFSGAFGGGLRLIGGAAIGAGLAGLVKSSVGLEASFSKTMAQVAAATDAPASSIDKLDKLALKLGADTAFSANEAADAMLELAKAGISTSDIMGGALDGTLLLATAGSVDLGTAATIASNAMNTFGLKGKDMAQIAAALAGGANASSASVESLGQALQQVGPGATNAGLSLQETVGVLSAFDAAGVKGSDAGTSLKTMLARLVPQTDKAAGAMRKLGLDFTDANGNFVPITNVAEQLRDKLSGLSEEQRTTALTTLFGSDATRAATVLMKEGAAGIGKYIKATKDQNAAEKLAKANMSGTSGALERLRGSIETAQLALGKSLAPTIQKTANFLSDKAVPAVTDFIGGMQDGTGAGGEFADVAKEIGAGLKDVFEVGKGVVEIFDSLPGPIKKFGVQTAIALVVLSKVRTTLGPATSSLSAFATGLRNVETRAATTGTAMTGLRGGVGNLALAGGMLGLADASNRTSKGLGALQGAATGAGIGFALGGPLGAGIGAIGGGLVGFAISGKKAEDQMDDLGEAAEISAGHFSEYQSTLEGVTAAITDQTREMVFNRLESSGLLAQTRLLGIEDRTAVNAILGQKDARAKLTEAMNSSKTVTNEVRAALRNEGVAINQSRLAQLQKNVAIAKTKEEVDRAKRALQEFARTNGTASIKVDGLRSTNAALLNTLTLLQQINSFTGMTPKDFNNQTDETGLFPRREFGGPVTAGQPYVVGEKRPELFVPGENGRIIPRLPVPTTSSSSGNPLVGQRITLTLFGQRVEGIFEAVADSRADIRIGAQGQIDGMIGRAFG